MIGDNRHPITIVTGFLGSGKTTLLSNVLKYEKFVDTAVVINEHGQADLDHRLTRRIEEKTWLPSGGCICCNVRDNLVKELKETLNESERGEIKLDRVIVETTGLTDPALILSSILMDPLLTNCYYVDCMVRCLDAANGELHLRNSPESIRQIVTADTVIVTKTDIVGKEHVIRMRERLRELDLAALIVRTANGIIAPEVVLSNSISRMDVYLTKFGRIKKDCCEMPAEHDSRVRSMYIRFYGPLDWTAFGLWMNVLLYVHGEKMMHIKGMVDVGVHGPIVISGVQHIIHPPRYLDSWSGEERDSQIAFIMKDLGPEQMLRSLVAFQNILGSASEIPEINLDPYSKE